MARRLKVNAPTHHHATNCAFRDKTEWVWVNPSIEYVGREKFLVWVCNDPHCLGKRSVNMRDVEKWAFA